MTRPVEGTPSVVAEEPFSTSPQQPPPARCENTVTAWSDHWTAPPAPAWNEDGGGVPPHAIQQLARKPIHPRDAEYDLTDREQVSQLIGRSTQVNPLSQDCGNGEYLCGAASIVNAMLLRGGAEADRAANANALADTFQAVGARQFLPDAVTPEAVEQALGRYTNGHVRPRDVEVLQQLAFAIASTMDRTPSGGLDASAMLGTVTQLVAHGAPLHDARFSLLVDHGAGHWTVQAGGLRADSSNGATREEKAPSSFNSLWEADVTVASANNEVTLRTRLVHGDDKKWSADVGAAFETTTQPVMVKLNTPSQVEPFRRHLRAAIIDSHLRPVSVDD